MDNSTHKTVAAKPTSEPIRRGESYTKQQFQARTGMREAVYRTARRQGLRTIETAGRAYITGDAWFDYIESLAKAK